MTLFGGLPLAIRGNSQSSHITRPRNERWRIIDSTDDVVVDHTTQAVLLDSRCTGPRRSRCSRMDHEVGVCRCEPRRCLRLELVDVSTCTLWGTYVYLLSTTYRVGLHDVPLAGPHAPAMPNRSVLQHACYAA